MMPHPIFGGTGRPLEYKTIAVGFGTCEQAQQSAREIKTCLDSGWILDRLLATPHSDFGCVVFVRPMAEDTGDPFTHFGDEGFKH